TGTGSGVATFYDSGVPIGSSTFFSGQATLITRSLPAGLRSLTARYVGDTNFGPSNSAPFSLNNLAAAANGMRLNTFTLDLSADRSIARDFDNDGKVDLLTARYDQLVFFKGKGDGSFEQGRSTANTTYISSFGVADLNFDGRLDVVIGGSNEY